MKTFEEYVAEAQNAETKTPKTPKLYDLANYDSKFAGYSLDANSNIWDGKRMISKGKTSLNGHPVNIHYLVKLVMKTPSWAEFIAS